MLRTYEALFLIKPETAEDEVQTIASGVESLITEDGGAIVRSEIWGKRRLAYPVQEFTEGIYVLMRFEAEPNFVKKLESQFKLNESVIRFLTVHFDAKTLRLEAEQARRNQDAIDARNESLKRDAERGQEKRAPAATVVEDKVEV